MSRKRIVGLIIADDENGSLGLGPAHLENLGSTTILGQTLRRLVKTRRLEKIIIAHRQGRKPQLPRDLAEHPRIALHATDKPLWDAHHDTFIVARKWSITAWRGGLGGATAFDELVSPVLAVEIMDQCEASAAVLIGADWPLVDPQLCDALVERHEELPEKLSLVFTQAVPGLVGCLITRDLLAELRGTNTSIGALLDYNPQRPQHDPIARENCIQLEAPLRVSDIRATCELPTYRRAIEHLFATVGEQVMQQMDAAEVVQRIASYQAAHPDALPRQFTIELTTERTCTGPIMPQHYSRYDRAIMSPEQARDLFQLLGKQRDTVITLGGIGDPLLHPQWRSIIDAAHTAGIWGIHVQTDLLVEKETLQSLLQSPVDVISINLHADSAKTYEQLMGVNGYAQVLQNIEWLMTQRGQGGGPGKPWIFARMSKVRDNLEEMETFVDRWTYLCGHALVDSPTTGGGLMPPLQLLDMAGPKRKPCRQLRNRATVLSDGTIALCDQDWLGQQTLGHLARQTMDEIGSRRIRVYEKHCNGKTDELQLCSTCRQWHRP